MPEVIFVFKKIVIRLLFPVCIALLLGILGVIFRRRKNWSYALFTAGVSWLLIFSFPVTGLELIRTLEAKAGPYADPLVLAGDGVKFIVVLSGGFRHGNLSPSDRLDSSVLRLIEGIRLRRAIPTAKLVLTGGKTPGLSPDMSLAQALCDMAVEMGVPKDAIILEAASWTTEDQAAFTRPIVGKEPFALVTSAYHLPRSLLLFKLAGLHPVPAPCDFLARKYYCGYETLIPQAWGLMLSQIATKEYLATWWARIKAGFSGNSAEDRTVGSKTAPYDSRDRTSAKPNRVAYVSFSETFEWRRMTNTMMKLKDVGFKNTYSVLKRPRKERRYCSPNTRDSKTPTRSSRNTFLWVS